MPKDKPLSDTDFGGEIIPNSIDPQVAPDFRGRGKTELCPRCGSLEQTDRHCCRCGHCYETADGGGSVEDSKPLRCLGCGHWNNASQELCALCAESLEMPRWQPPWNKERL